jgi:pantoate--beta-alanine ligase
LEVLRTIAELKQRIADWRREGSTIGEVLTMGALHEGHLAMIDRSRRENDRTLVTDFVNPLQLFGDDYRRYPRQEEADIEFMRKTGADVLFAPTNEEFFPGARTLPDDFLTVVTVRKLTDRLCARVAPGLYEGIATEVARWLILTQPDVSYFGEKDYQQLRVVSQLCVDLGIPVRIAEVPTLRLPDGLPYGSRNLQLSPEHRRIAPGLYRALTDAAAELEDPDRPTAPVIAQTCDRLLEMGFDPVDYVEVCDEVLLQPLERVDRPARVFGRAWLGHARLTDNARIRTHAGRRGAAPLT